MKKLFLSILAFAALCLSSPLAQAEPHQVMQGMQMRLTLLNTLGTNATRDGDPFVAVVAEPVTMGGTLLIPAGSRVRGTVGTVGKARRFSMFRGQAYMNLDFRSIEIDGRLIPVQLSILSIQQPSNQADGKRRKDVKIDEGQVVEAKHDIKGDVVAATIGTGGGTLVGAVFSHAIRGFGLGLAGSAVYVVARKGKEVELPAQTTFLVRMDNTITVPTVTASNSVYNGGR